MALYRVTFTKLNGIIMKQLYTFKRVVFLLYLVLMSFATNAQNAIVGSGFTNGWPAACNQNTNFVYFSAGAGSSWTSGTLAPKGTGNQYWRMGVDWSGTIKQLNNGSNTDEVVTPGTKYTLNATCTANGAFFRNISSLSNRYVFKTKDAGTAPTGDWVFFELDASPITISSVTQSPVAVSVISGQSTTVSATLSAALPAGQGVYLRYTDNNYATSTVVELSGSGTSYTASIPAVFNTAGANVNYYLFTSGSGLTINGEDADLYTINLNNNGGPNYTYTVLPVPTITLGANPIACEGTALANLTYTATTNGPNQYSIAFDSTALGQGFADVTNAALPTSPIVITIPTSAAAATYNATLSVRNSTSGAVSADYPITITVASLLTAGITNNTGSTQITCELTAINVTATGGTGYSWSNGATVVGTAANLNITAGGTYTVTANNALGCSATATIVITENKTTTSSETASACDAYTWASNGQTYSASGDYTSVTTDAFGCVNTATLHLTITPSTTNTTTITACDDYTWPINNQQYLESGVYTVVTGCHTEVLDLTINPATNSSTIISACDSYTWSVNNVTYTQSGKYIVTIGCDTYELQLTITPSSTATTTISACDNYTWSVNNETYTSSGTYTFEHGCETDILVLTIIPTATNTTTITACDSYTWNFNGQTFTTSGTYTVPNGCQTEVLVLTITPSTTSESTASACDAYTWFGTTYTTSGDYTHTTGCNTETLHLTIAPSTTNTTSVTAIGSYTWAVNGQTYTTSGTYSYAVPNTCNTEYLALTITVNAVITTQPVNTILCATVGATTTYSVTSTMPNPTYAWQYRVVTTAATNPAWITITAANAAVYQNYNTAILTVTKTATLPAVGTEYRVLISGNAPSLTSNTAKITLIGTTKGGTIATAATTVCLGSDLVFTLSGYTGTSFQWQSSPISTSTAPGVFNDIPGATGTTYTLTNAQLNTDRSYRVVVSNSCTSTTAVSGTKTITVTPPSVAGTITGGGTVCSGSNATLKITGQLGKVQWEYSEDGDTYLSAPTASAGQTTPFGTSSTTNTGTTYIVTNMTSDLYFRAKVTNGTCSSVYTEPVLYGIGTEAIVGTITPATATICSGTGTTLTLSEAVGVITWQKSTNYTAATPNWYTTTNHTLTYPTGNLSMSTAFRVMVTIGSCATVYSDIAIISLVAKPVAKPIVKNTTTPSGATLATALCTNDASKVLTVGAGAVGTIQWQWSTTSTTTGFTDISGATGTSYTIINPSVGANYYRVIMSNSCGASVTGTAVTVFYTNCSAPKTETKTPWMVTAYPNPYNQNFNLSLTTSSNELVGVTIYDMTGKLIEKRQVSPTEVPQLQVGDRYPSGVYNVVVTQESEVKTLRVIKQ